MAEKFDTKEYQEIHDEALREFDRVQSAMRDERLQCLQDRRFATIAGAQWEGPLAEQFENKPKFEINKVHLAVVRIVNEYRNNRISVKFVPKDGATNMKLADTCAGLYRADEQDSTAEEAYDNAFEEAAYGGFGAFRYRADYENEEDEDDEKQRIFIEPIFDADSSVFFDIDAKRQDKADAKRCWVLSAMSRQNYESEYGKSAPASMPKLIHQRQFDWLTPDVVYTAEYYRVEKISRKVVTYRGLNNIEQTFDAEELDAEKKQELTDTGFKRVKTRTLKTPKVRKFIISGMGIEDDCGYIAGKHIPIVPVYGKRWFIDNVERCMGHVRLAKDAQRIKNMQMSKLGEIAAKASNKKPIFTPQQMAGHAEMWSSDNTEDWAYLLLNPMTDANGQVIQAGPIAYTEPPDVPTPMAALLQVVEQDIKDILGNQEAGEEIQSNISGVAVELVQQKLDMQTYIYISNMAKALQRGGQIWLEMAKDVYVEEDRKRKTVNDQGETSYTTLMQPNVDEDTGETKVMNDLSEADFDVSAIPGPSSASKRASTVRSLLALMGATQDPETVAILTAMILMNVEIEGIDDIRDYYRKKLVSMGVVQPTPEEAQQLEQAKAAAASNPPSPNDAFLLASAKQAEADAMAKQASTVKTAADAKLSEAKAAQIISEIQGQGSDMEFKRIEALQNAALTNSQLQKDASQQALMSAQHDHVRAQIQHTNANTALTNAQAAAPQEDTST